MTNSTQNIRVLIAEDDYLVSEMIKGVVQKNGCTVVGEAVDGLEAVEMTKRLQPDVVLMDIKMPRMNGIEATRRIAAECPTPVVALTAYNATDTLVKEIRSAGALAWLSKPPGMHELSQAISAAITHFNQPEDIPIPTR